MRSWRHRPKEIAYLLNPAFCGRLLYAAIKKYEKEAEKPMPFPLIYLILPLVLHKKTREQISSRTQLINWIQNHPEILIDFDRRTKNLITITNEAVDFLLGYQLILLNERADISINTAIRSLSSSKYMDDEIKDCLKKSQNVANWFARTGKVETVYISLGVKP